MNGLEKLVSDLVRDCREKNLTSARMVGKNIFDFIWPKYKGRAPRWKVKAVAEDLAESVCL